METVRVKYVEGPDYIDVYGHGRHHKGQIKKYPAGFAEELIETNARKHVFEIVGEEEAAPEREMTVLEVRAALEEKGVEIPKGARKAELLALLELAPPPEAA